MYRSFLDETGKIKMKRCYYNLNDLNPMPSPSVTAASLLTGPGLNQPPPAARRCPWAMGVNVFLQRKGDL